jgi:hypothetical protein
MLWEEHYCFVCERTIGGSWQRGCPECLAKDREAKRKAHLARLEGLTLQERVRRIEEILWDRERRL